MIEYGLKPLEDEAINILEAFYQKLTERRKHCYFCKGGNTCRCGQCPEIEYHDTDCLVSLLDMIIHQYHYRKKSESRSLMLITVEEVNWYRDRIKELETQLGIDEDW